MKRRFYIFSTGILQRQDNSLVYITKKGKEYIPIFQTEIIYIFGSCTLNKTVLQILSEYNIILIFFSYYGRYIGSYLPRQNYIGQITQLQIELFKDKNKVFSYQKEIIYNAYHESEAKIDWVDNTTVSINGKTLDMSSGETYDWRKE